MEAYFFVCAAKENTRMYVICMDAASKKNRGPWAPAFVVLHPVFWWSRLWSVLGIVWGVFCCCLLLFVVGGATPKKQGTTVPLFFLCHVVLGSKIHIRVYTIMDTAPKSRGPWFP